MDVQPLWGVPVSLKDCFDLTGFATFCAALLSIAIIMALPHPIAGSLKSFDVPVP